MAVSMDLELVLFVKERTALMVDLATSLKNR